MKYEVHGKLSEGKLVNAFKNGRAYKTEQSAKQAIRRLERYCGDCDFAVVPVYTDSERLDWILKEATINVNCGYENIVWDRDSIDGEMRSGT